MAEQESLAVLLGWMGCHNKDPGVSGTSSGVVLRVFGVPVSSVHHIVHQLGLQG